jgi:hypothetical protein
MANEIQLTAGLQHAQAGSSVVASTVLNVDQTSTERIANTQSILTSSTTITLGNITPRYAYFKNLDATNFVYIGYQTAATSGNAFLKLLPGQANVVSLAQSVLYAIADTATVLLEVIIIEA